MRYRKLGDTDILVSVIGLGTMTWGEQNSEAEAHQQLDYSVAQGVNFIDTAELYPVPPHAATQGLTESYLGSWLKARGNRDQLTIASKVVGPGSWVNYFRDGPQLDRGNIEAAVNASLRRLQTDWIDLYQVHWPERSTNFFGKLGYADSPDSYAATISIDETLEALTDLVTSGKVRQIGISNETPWGMMQYLILAKQKNFQRIVSIQNPYNLLNRSFEVGLAEMAQREKCGLLAYSPIAMGVLSGKYLDGNLPPGSRLKLFPDYTRYSTAEAQAATAEYVALARAHELDPVRMALAYVNSRPFVTSTLVGATSMDQLKTNIDSINLELSADTVEAIEAIHQRYPNPSP